MDLDSLSSLTIVFIFLIWLDSKRFCSGVGITQHDTTYTSLQLRPCWEMEEFLVLKECTQCSDYEKKARTECSSTGFVENVKCKNSDQVELRSCRSVTAEELKFWKFEALMFSIGTVFAILVVLRQQTLDQKAEQKVLRQIEGI
ncbi:protein JTB [Latimeria chalumnae]|uniref:Protein JTB n=1 Tax=Latimeria chalumnae TaxID=7897 RepID=H3A1R7_LATCH|nr:PREDICTED: protein JTB-like [Latimeria chalumnae]XP_006002778.1 PREDICTED: protein JTB-like [Latimeria chalumnae]XP_006002779.1 PREDICTED: protein JTB-like [Latimeria chalumnae]XP_014348027.1 PREDICTED: protein JTB-like [Latimeria chalumnae]|eukprot:XP_006002776.1 PREDICTED: protein JTB-like [Latimeria chalumnae]